MSTLLSQRRASTIHNLNPKFSSGKREYIPRSDNHQKD